MRNYYFDGKIDDIRIYNRALSETEVEAIYNSTDYDNDGMSDVWEINYFGDTSRDRDRQ